MRDMYDKAKDGMVSKLLKRSKPSNLAYVADLEGGALFIKWTTPSLPS